MTDSVLSAALSTANINWIVPDWPAPGNVHALSTTRRGSAGQAIDFSRAHRGIDAARAELRRFVPEDPLWLAQEHGIAIADADVRHAVVPRADGAAARVAGRVCAVLSADCMPVLFSDRNGDAVAAAHAGWRGLSTGVLEAAVSAMGVAPGDVLTWLGPAIGPRAFEVGEDVLRAFCDTDHGAATCFVAHRPGKWHADLYALARRRLAQAGVTAVYGGGRCTYTEGDCFYSYRRGGADAGGRMVTAIWRVTK